MVHSLHLDQPSPHSHPQPTTNAVHVATVGGPNAGSGLGLTTNTKTTISPQSGRAIVPSAASDIMRVLRSGGVRGLYRGLIPEIIKITPMISITFSVYEFTLELMADRAV